MIDEGNSATPLAAGSPLRVALVAGETSGDLLGAGLIRTLTALRPGSRFEGIAGPQMVAAGCTALWPAERLAAFGFADVLAHLPDGLRLRRALVRRLLDDPPDVFVGIDAPAFNLGLEARLHRAGIPTVHYVSPTVWAWRRYRMRTLRRGLDLLLTLFPFEAEFCRQHGLQAAFVGHPLAEAIPFASDRGAVREALGLPDAEYVALLPGSRGGEIRHLATTFLDTAAWLVERRPGIRFLLPAATPRLRERLQSLLDERPALPLTLLDGQARDALVIANAVLTASGTATLETLLVKRPMVMAYRLAPLTYHLSRPFVRVSHFALPNLLAGERVVPEFIQDAATAGRLGPAVLELLDNPDARAAQVDRFAELHRQLRRGADQQAARAVAALVDARRDGSRP